MGPEGIYVLPNRVLCVEFITVIRCGVTVAEEKQKKYILSGCQHKLLPSQTAHAPVQTAP